MQREIQNHRTKTTKALRLLLLIEYSSFLCPLWCGALRSSLAESSPSFLKTVQHAHMPSANEIKSLFRAYLRLGRNFPNYNIRQ